MSKKDDLDLFLNNNIERRLGRIFPFVQEPQTVGSSAIDPEKAKIEVEPISVSGVRDLIQPDGLNLSLSIYLSSVESDSDEEKIGILRVQSLTDALTSFVILHEVNTESSILEWDFFSTKEITLDNVVSEWITNEIVFWSWKEISFESMNDSKVEQIKLLSENAIFIEESIEKGDEISLAIEGLIVVETIDAEETLENIEIEIQTADILFSETNSEFDVGAVSLKNKFVDAKYQSGFDLIDANITQRNTLYQNLIPTETPFGEMFLDLVSSQISTKLEILDESRIIQYGVSLADIHLDQVNNKWMKRPTLAESHLHRPPTIFLQQQTTAFTSQNSHDREEDYIFDWLDIAFCTDQIHLTHKKVQYIEIRDNLLARYRIAAATPTTKNFMMFAPVEESKRISESFELKNGVSHQTQRGEEYLKIDFFRFKEKPKLMAAISQNSKVRMIQPIHFDRCIETHSTFQIDQVSVLYQNDFFNNNFFEIQQM